MKKLGDRNYTLISDGVKTLGTYNPDEIFCCFEEHLYMHEAKEIYDFLKWVHETNNDFGSGNYEEVFALFKRTKKTEKQLKKLRI